MSLTTKKTGLYLLVSIVVTLGLIFGGMAFSGSMPTLKAAAAATIRLTVDGVTKTVQVASGTVQDVLKEEDVSLEGAVVQPRLTTPLRDGAEVTVRYERDLDLILDGEKESYTVYEPVLEDALQEALPLLPEASYTSEPVTSEVPREGLDKPVVVSTPKALVLEARGVKHTVYTSSPTVDAVLAEEGLTPDKDDYLSTRLTAYTSPGMAITYRQRSMTDATVRIATPFATIEEEDPELPEGETRVITPGVDKVELRTVRTLRVDGKRKKSWVVKSVVSKKGRDEVVAIGTAIVYPDVDPGSARAIAQEQMRAYGWGGDEFNCLDTLWMRESGWNYRADNPYSSAYGIPQSLPGSKMASAGPDWLTNPATQIEWGLGYIKDRYGSPCAALSHSDSQGFY